MAKREYPIELNADEIHEVLGALRQMNEEYGLRVGFKPLPPNLLLTEYAAAANRVEANGRALIGKFEELAVLVDDLEPSGA